MNNYTRFSTAFVVMLVILSVISVTMAVLYGAELLLFLVITLPMVISILVLKKYNRNDHDNWQY